MGGVGEGDRGFVENRIMGSNFINQISAVCQWVIPGAAVSHDR